MNMKRMRGRNHRSGGGGGGGGSGGGPIRQHGGGIPLNRNHVFDSSGPDLRVRGTAQQLFERYLQLGRDATSVGDRVMAESYFQHAEHYFRILNAMTQAQQGQAQGQNSGQNQNGQQQRRPSMHDQSGYEQSVNESGSDSGGENGMGDGFGDSDDGDGHLPGLGDQPNPDLPGSNQSVPEPRHIPIAVAPPEA